MFKRLLVPLDGSRLAESALPTAAYLAVRLRASVTLIHIIERNAPQEIHGDRHLTGKEEAMAYLQEVAQRAFPPSVQVDIHVHRVEVSDVARSIVDHTDEFDPDLIVMCTHGESGLRDRLVGSIAQQVIASGETPVLLIQPDEQGRADADPIRRILVAMDGKDEHERGLEESVTSLAEATGARLHLLTVIETLSTLGVRETATAMMLPAATRAMLDMAEESACEHLQTHADAWEAKGIPVTTEVLRGDPATQIAEEAKGSNDDLIVLGTHGRTGLDAFWSGSVAPKVLGMTKIPLLIIPVGPHEHS